MHEVAERLAAARDAASIGGILADACLDGAASLGPGDLARTLDALSQAFPYPAFLFDPGGALRWMSDEGAARLGVAAARVGSARLVRGTTALEGLSACAAACAGKPGLDVEPPLRRQGTLHRGERLVARRFAGGAGALLLLSLVPALAWQPGDGAGAPATLPRLGGAESRVARLAAEGYTVLNMAARLAMSEATVRTHLRRVYAKLGVHGRAELAYLLLRGA